MICFQPGENDNSGYGNYGGYGGSYSGYSPPAGLPSPPIQSPSPHQQMPHASMNKKSQLIMTDTRLTMNGHQPVSTVWLFLPNILDKL